MARLGHRFVSSHGMGLTLVQAMEMLWMVDEPEVC
jgi:hypothetical protein